MTRVTTIVEALARQELLGAWIKKSPESWAPWTIFFKAVYGLPMDDAEFELFKSCTGRTRRPSGPFAEVYADVGRRGGKSSAVALMATWEAISRPWSKWLAPGERVFLVVVAVDRAQAGTIFRYIKGIFHAAPALRAMVSAEKTEELELRNSVTITVKTASFRSLRGLTIGLFVGDEVAFWRSEDSANPDREILVAARPALATVDGRLVCISTPYARSGVMYETFKSGWGNDDSPTLVWKAPSLVMNPTLRREFVEAQLKDDPAANRAEWLAEFREDIERFLSPELLEPCVVKDRGDLPPVAGLSYVWTLDPSGGRSDSMTLCGSHTTDDGGLIVDVLRERRPPFSPAEVAADFSALMKRYGGAHLISDRFGGEWVSEAFRAHDVHVKAADYSASEAYLELLPRITNQTIQLPDSKKLTAQLVGLERRTRPSGGETITHFPGAHDDLANVVALAAAHAKEVHNVRRYEVLYMDENGHIDKGLTSEVSEFREKDIPPEFRSFVKLKFGIRWLAAIYAAEHDLARAAKLVGEDAELMRRFNHTFHGWLSKISQLYPSEVQEAYEKMAKRP
jgi:hypothetical protein